MPKSDKLLELQYSLPMNIGGKKDIDFHRESTIDDELDLFTSGMAGTEGSSPFIKDEFDDSQFLHNLPPSQQTFNIPMNEQYGQLHQPNGVGSPNMNMTNGNYGQFGMNPQQQMSNSYNVGNSGINDDELEGLDLNAPGPQGFGHGTNMFFPNQAQQGGRQMQNQYSSTPDGAPIQSPFVHGGFNYAAFNNMQQPANHASPQMQPSVGNAYQGSRASHVAPQMNRQSSETKMPMTPRTPGISGLHLETPMSGSLPSQPIRYSGDRQKRTSGQWDSNPDSLHSHGDAPISSPGYQANQKQIAELLQSGKHASLPAKVDQPSQGYGNTQSQQEAKRRKRRESHNMVERRRRDHINERIQELSQLVPQHRLDDEKVKKHIMNNSPLSPSLAATGMSPPPATSLLAAGGRRATSGSISLGLPPDDKDKGPNKGDILNGSVSWTRDLMWALWQKYQQEDELAEYLANLGGQWPFQQSEDEKRMRHELMEAMNENNGTSFNYSRGTGSGLRVPGFTNDAGEPIQAGQMGTISPQSLSPTDHGGNHNMNDVNSMPHDHQLWSPSFKEEDEYNMQLN